MQEALVEAPVKSRPRPAASPEATAKKATPATLSEHIVEIVSDSGEGAQRCGQTFGAIASQMGLGVWTVEIIPPETRTPSPPAASPAAAATAFALAQSASPMGATKPTW